MNLETEGKKIRIIYNNINFNWIIFLTLSNEWWLHVTRSSSLSQILWIFAVLDYTYFVRKFFLGLLWRNIIFLGKILKVLNPSKIVSKWWLGSLTSNFTSTTSLPPLATHEVWWEKKWQHIFRTYVYPLHLVLNRI